MAKAAPQPEYNLVLKHPALFATVITIGIAAVFLGALFQSCGAHDAPHGATPAAASSAHGPGATSAKAGVPAASAPPKH